MHPDVAGALTWSNSAARNKLLKRLEASEVITPAEVARAKAVVQIRHTVRQHLKSMRNQDAALETLREQAGLSRRQFKALCKLACVCIADGNWYVDLASRLKHKQYQVPRELIKPFDHLKLCMLVAA